MTLTLHRTLTLAACLLLGAATMLAQNTVVRQRHNSNRTNTTTPSSRTQKTNSNSRKTNSNSRKTNSNSRKTNSTRTSPSTYSDPTGYSNGYAYVDLGLSVKWATCNVGASSPTGYGNYYAWGETTTKSDYSSSTSKTYGVENSTLRSRGIINSYNNLTAAYDAARANWGGSWRLPTKAEIEELVANCTTKRTTIGGVKGRLVTSNKNGRSIFLPAAGYRYGTSLGSAGSYGSYWSSTPDESYTGNACSLDFDGSSFGRYWYDRNDGRSVRPVLE